MKKQPSRRARQKGAQVRGTSAPDRENANAETEARPPVRRVGERVLEKSVIAIPLIKILEQDKAKPDKLHKVVIDLNLEHPKGVRQAQAWTIETIEKIVAKKGIQAPRQGIWREGTGTNAQYLFAQLKADAIRELVNRNDEAHAIFHIWPDFEVKALINKSISTVKADAAHASFSAFGEEIVWAVLDSGIDASHQHFKQYGNLILDLPLKHEDFSGTGPANEDPLGHGTHVAGIIAGALTNHHSPPSKTRGIHAFTRYLDEQGNPQDRQLTIDSISGMAPRCKLVSMKVLDQEGRGSVSSVLDAIGRIQEINGYGRRLLIHGVNMSIGYDFDPEWFACGQSPLCVEVNRLVSSGVIVVVAAGNAGYGKAESQGEGTVYTGLGMTIGDPGNAESAITVGSTHRNMPHTYGVSYFSSKGPTGDGRLKPDVIAPGEKIISCAAGSMRVHSDDGNCEYVESNGTSMAAPHVSGVIAAFLSVRREFIGQPDRVKQIFLSNATDLKRERYFQGYGLVDLMRAIQSV